MEWSERMNAAVDYIEENLAGDIDFTEAANRTCCSKFHFQRMFFAIIGVTPAEYVRRRRLTLAATELSSSREKVIDIAMKYGYDSPDSFTRAFRNVHGVTPTAAREPGVNLTTYPRISFHIELKGGTNMDYRIVEKPAFEVIAKPQSISAEIVHKWVIIPEDWEKFWWDYWEAFFREKRGESLDKMSGGKPGLVTGARYLAITTIDSDIKSFSYAVGIEKPDGPLSAGYEVITIPAATWAVFESIGPLPKAIHDLEDKVFTEWFPSTGYEHDTKPELEVYLPGDTNSQDYRCQFWEPVVKK
ncbi:MAG TPA: AraC family transcriptional regulator [Dehalococcoidia bacterium]|nr:AraC family transcriptional regulator [Dehalococcoidia bacterium]